MPDWTIYALGEGDFRTCPGTDVVLYARRQKFSETCDVPSRFAQGRLYKSIAFERGGERVHVERVYYVDTKKGPDAPLCFTLFMRVEGSDALRRDIDRIVREHR